MLCIEFISPILNYNLRTVRQSQVMLTHWAVESAYVVILTLEDIG